MDDYTKFYRELNDSVNDEDVYTKLMNKEMHVLNTINKVVDMNQSNKVKKGSLLDQPARILLKNTVKNVYETFQELQEGKKNIRKVFRKRHRIFYLGLFIVGMALLLMVIYISDESS